MISQDKFRSHAKKKDLVLDTPLIIQILEFIHPHLYCIISPKLISYCGGQKESLPVSILLSLCSLATLESFKTVLLGYKFNYHSFTLVVASWGDFETIRWFHSNGWGFHYEMLPIIAKRGDEVVFMKYLQFCKENFDKENIEVSLTEALVVAAKLGRINILEAANSTEEEVVIPNRNILLEAAAICGQVYVLQWIWNYLSAILKENCNLRWNLLETIKKVVKANHIHVLEWLSSNFKWTGATRKQQDEADGIMYSAVINGNIDIVRWLSSKNIKGDANLSTLTAAARGGNLEVLKHVLSLGCPWIERVCMIAAENGNLEVLKWAVRNGYPRYASEMCPAAASCQRPNMELYQWLFDQGCPFVEAESFKIAGKVGNFEFIQFAQSKGSTEYDQLLNKWMIQGAIRTGRVEALEWSLGQVDKKGLSLDINRTDEQWIDRRLKNCWISWAAEHGHVNILEYLRVWFGDEFWVAPLFRSGVRFGNLTRLYTVSISDIVTEVAKWGHVNVLDWIAKYSTNWNTALNRAAIFQNAIECKNLKVLIWLKSHPAATSTQTWYGDISSMLNHPSDRAFEVGDFDIFKWIHMNGCPWNADTDWSEICTTTNLLQKQEFLKFAARNRCPHAHDVMTAIELQRFRMMERDPQWSIYY